jgi:hypothetical protein
MGEAMNANQTGHSVNRERGSVLVISLLVMIVLSILGVTMMGMSLTESTVAANWRDQTQAFYAAEAGIESGLAKLKALLVNSPIPTDTELNDLNTSAIPTLSDSNFSFKTFTVQRVRTTIPYSYASKIDSGTYKGLSAIRTDYQITAEVTGPRGSRAKLNQLIQYMEIPLFQFGAFYGRGVDLEITPMTNMIQRGWVHANSNIFVYAGGPTLQFDSSVTTSGHFYRYIKKEPLYYRANNPEIKDANGVYQRLDFDYQYSPGFTTTWTPADWKAAALNKFQGTVLDKEMGVTDIVLPLPDLLSNPSAPNPDVISHQLIEKGLPGDSPGLKAAKLYYQADLRILTDTGGTTTVTRNDGTSVTLNPGVITGKTFWDNRDKQYITVTEVNVGLLKANLGSLFPGPTQFNGILYVSDDRANTGVRLVNGTQLPSTGLTVASEKPAYIQGDYNTINKVPAAVLADAITVLSNYWGPNGSDADAKATSSNIGDRPATSTEINAAFMLGPAYESTLGKGNGQLENVIRSLEHWNKPPPGYSGQQTLKYTGSIVSLWHSQHAQGQWGCCGSSTWHYYYPPIRDWSFDLSFLVTPPPGTPKVVYVVKGRWWQE